MAKFLTFADYTNGYIFDANFKYRISVCKAEYSFLNSTVQILVEVKSTNGNKAFLVEEFDPKSEEFKYFLTVLYPIDCDGKIVEVDLEDFEQLSGEGYIEVRDGKPRVIWCLFEADITPHNALFLSYVEEQ